MIIYTRYFTFISTDYQFSSEILMFLFTFSFASYFLVSQEYLLAFSLAPCLEIFVISRKTRRNS